MKILYFSPIPWDYLKQRPQHLAEELSKYHTIYYIEPSISFIHSLFNKDTMYKYRKFDVNDKLTVIRYSGMFRLPRSIEAIDLIGLNNIYEKRLLKELIQECDIMWLGSPIFYSLLTKKSSKKIVYDKMDNYIYLTKNWWLKKVIQRLENKLVNNASLIFVSCTKFFNDFKGKNVFIVNNGVEYNFSNYNSVVENITAKRIVKLKEDNKIIFGYIGTIDHWFDYEAINSILTYNNNFHVFIVGRNNIPRIQHNNIHYSDSVPKFELSRIIENFDYCLYPFNNNEFVNTINPVKIYEYLSMNKPIIAVYSLEIQKFGNHIYSYKNHLELLDILHNYEKLEKPFKSDNERSKFMDINTWESRAIDIVRKIDLYIGG